ncbi:hypothetical protein D3C79_1018720 [compost metagenome]
MLVVSRVVSFNDGTFCEADALCLLMDSDHRGLGLGRVFSFKDGGFFRAEALRLLVDVDHSGLGQGRWSALPLFDGCLQLRNRRGVP